MQIRKYVNTLTHARIQLLKMHSLKLPFKTDNIKRRHQVRTHTNAYIYIYALHNLYIRVHVSSLAITITVLCYLIYIPVRSVTAAVWLAHPGQQTDGPRLPAASVVWQTSAEMASSPGKTWGTFTKYFAEKSKKLLNVREIHRFALANCSFLGGCIVCKPPQNM